MPRASLLLSLPFLSLLLNPFSLIGETATAASATLLQTSGVNVALASNGAIATASSIFQEPYPASSTINGDRKGLNWGTGGGWKDNTSGQYPDWLQVDFAGIQTISEIDVFAVQDSYTNPSEPTLTMTFTQYGVTSFSVQYWDGSNWVTVTGGSVTGNNQVWRKFTFTAVTTTRIRVYITDALNSYSRLVEVEAWTPSQPPSVSITSPSNGTVLLNTDPLTIDATAGDADGTITKVEFFQGGTKLGESTTSPYSFIWSNIQPGSYSLTARVTDNSNTVGISAAVSITMPVGWIAGRVTRAGGTTAIAGVAVKVYQGVALIAAALTNATGDYTIGVLNTGTYTIEASAAGYETNTQAGITVTVGTTTLNISLAVPIHYLYDDLGRLISVIDKEGNAATYSYDSVGNLLSISRQVPTQVSIIQFNPSSGPVGTAVTIYGAGFSATANENGVSFNGTAATVTASSTNLIVAVVPAGSTTGPISVTSPVGNATSAAAFTVGSASPGAPTITGFTPTVGPTGTPITITGTNFETVLANDKPTVNISQAVAASATSTNIATSIPLATASGRISVTTPMGKAVSTADFIVPPYPYTASDIAFSGRMTIGATSTLTVGTANKIGLLLFDGTANQRVSLSYSNNTIGIGAMTIISPIGTSVYSQFSGLFQSSGFVEPIRLPMTGTYSILIDPESTNTGSMPITLYDVPPDITGSITIGGSPVAVTTTVPGQKASLSFNANAGQKVSVSISGSTLSLADIYIKDSWGTNLVSQVINTGNAFVDTVTLASTGSYSISIDPRTTSIGSVTLTLNNTNTITGSITAGGSPVNVTINTPGQSAMLLFSGTAGQLVSLKGANNQLSSCFIGIFKPDGTSLSSIWGSIGSSPYIDAQTLPVTGTYSVVVNPDFTYTGTITLTLYEVPADASGTITVGGSSVPVNITVPGQNGILTFSGTSAQQATVHITGNTMGIVTISLLKPDGSTLTSAWSAGASFNLATQTLPTTGTYTVRVDPAGANTGSLNVSVTSP